MGYNSNNNGSRVMVLILNMFYQCMKFQVDSLYSLKVMAQTKFGLTDGRTDRRTGGWTDKVTPVYPSQPTIHLVGI